MPGAPSFPPLRPFRAEPQDYEQCGVATRRAPGPNWELLLLLLLLLPPQGASGTRSLQQWLALLPAAGPCRASSASSSASGLPARLAAVAPPWPGHPKRARPRAPRACLRCAHARAFKESGDLFIYFLKSRSTRSLGISKGSRSSANALLHPGRLQGKGTEGQPTSGVGARSSRILSSRPASNLHLPCSPHYTPRRCEDRRSFGCHLEWIFSCNALLSSQPVIGPQTGWRVALVYTEGFPAWLSLPRS